MQVTAKAKDIIMVRHCALKPKAYIHPVPVENAFNTGTGRMKTLGLRA